MTAIIPVTERQVTFDEWWSLHQQAICICPGQCLWRILEVQEGWADVKARSRLLSFLKIQPSDPMPPEYVKNAETSVPSENQVESGEIA